MILEVVENDHDFQITSKNTCTNARGVLTSDEGALSDVTLELSPVGMTLDDLHARGRVSNPGAVSHDVLDFLKDLHAGGLVFMNLRTSNIMHHDVFDDEKDPGKFRSTYHVINFKYVCPEGEEVPKRLRYWDTLKNAGFKTGESRSS